MKLENRVAILTGGAHGIGLAIAKRYVAGGRLGLNYTVPVADTALD
jgi:NAD(P)-dependent dehydrogenase (short-subunit alcohol dehydrogenase family)